MGLSSETQEQGAPFVKGDHDFLTGVTGVCLVLRSNQNWLSSHLLPGQPVPAKVLLLWRGWEWMLGTTRGWMSATLEQRTIWLEGQFR